MKFSRLVVAAAVCWSTTTAFFVPSSTLFSSKNTAAAAFVPSPSRRPPMFLSSTTAAAEAAKAETFEFTVRNCSSIQRKENETSRAVYPLLTPDWPDMIAQTDAALLLRFHFHFLHSCSPQSDVGRVMDLIINSLYSDKDIFLRELVSNAADACDKKRFLSLTTSSSDGDVASNAAVGADLPQVKIRANPDDNTIIIQDSGVGMTKDELINNLGMLCSCLLCLFLSLSLFWYTLGITSQTLNIFMSFVSFCLFHSSFCSLLFHDDVSSSITTTMLTHSGKIAQSGTRAFVDALGAGSADVNLIGQFGVGFYSAYLVADKVEVVTKSMQAGSKCLRWTSDASSSYTIEEVVTTTPADSDSNSASDDAIFGDGESGTRLVLHLKEEAADYLETSTIEELLNRYSEYIEFPISIYKEKTEYVQVPDDEANKDLPEGDAVKMKTVPQTKSGYERVNNNKPIWLRPPRDVKDEEYQEFYKSAFRSSYDTPMKWTHFVLEGQVECKALLYIPGMLPFELSKDMFDENARNIRLYVKRVFINDSFSQDLMPRWLKFVRGVVDSNDLPLNVSREILQKSKVLSIINKRLVRKSLDMIREIADDEKKTDEANDEKKGDDRKDEEEDKTGNYILFWNSFGKYLKVGVVEDDVNRKEIAPLLRFYSSKSGQEYTSLDQYVKNMPEKQKAIYYVTGDGRDQAAMSPVIEKLDSRGYEVLFATEPLDEIMMESLRSFAEKDIVHAAKENLRLDDDDDDASSKEEKKKKQEQLREEYKQVIEYLETLLNDKIQRVVVSDLLTGSPAALVQGAYGMSPTMQRYMRAQSVAAGGNDAGFGMPSGMNKAVLEINPNHGIVKDLDRMLKSSGGGREDDKEVKDFALLLYDVAAMTSGYEVGDMRGFAKRVMGLMDPNAVQDAEVASNNEEKE
jgi:HSP90 family molecular chaperone